MKQYKGFFDEAISAKRLNDLRKKGKGAAAAAKMAADKLKPQQSSAIVKTGSAIKKPNAIVKTGSAIKKPNAIVKSAGGALKKVAIDSAKKKAQQKVQNIYTKNVDGDQKKLGGTPEEQKKKDENEKKKWRPKPFKSDRSVSSAVNLGDGPSSVGYISGN